MKYVIDFDGRNDNPTVFNLIVLTPDDMKTICFIVKADISPGNTDNPEITENDVSFTVSNKDFRDSDWKEEVLQMIRERIQVRINRKRFEQLLGRS